MKMWILLHILAYFFNINVILGNLLETFEILQTIYFVKDLVVLDAYHIRDGQIIDSIFLGIGLIMFRFLKRPHNFDQKSPTYFHVK